MWHVKISFVLQYSRSRLTNLSSPVVSSASSGGWIHVSIVPLCVTPTVNIDQNSSSSMSFLASLSSFVLRSETLMSFSKRRHVFSTTHHHANVYCLPEPNAVLYSLK